MKHKKKIFFGEINYYDGEKIKRLVLTSICIALASLINLTYFTTGFIITLSVILLPVFLYFNREFNPILLTACVAIVSPIFRGLLLFISHFPMDEVYHLVITDVVFYCFYGVLYYVLYWRKSYAKLSVFFVISVLCDFLSNVLELSLLLHFTGYTYSMFQGLVAIAFLRSMVSSGFIMFYRYFGFLLNKEEHEERYRYLIWLTSMIKSEIYFMEKNLNDIEHVMKNAYLLNKKLGEEKISPEYKETAFDIARDVHEIKKNYLNVIKGLEEGFGDVSTSGMTLTDILNVVVEDAKEYIRRNKLSVLIEVKNELDFYVEKHYYLVSVLSNFLYNSIDALEGNKKGHIKIMIQKQEELIWVQITDNGMGIPEKDLGNIFLPGFTSKYDQETGDVYRGIGLSHAPAIIRDEFNGDLFVSSKEALGTQFDIFLKEDLLCSQKMEVK